MKFSLFLMCFSALGAMYNFYIVPDDKPFMYFDGSEWKALKPNRYSIVNSIATPQPYVTVNSKISEIIAINNNNGSAYNSKFFKDYGIHKRAQDSDEFKTTAEPSVHEVGETNIIISQLLDLIENRHKDTKEKSQSASLLANPKAWIKLISELSDALKEITDKANASYYTLTQETTPKYVVEPWRKVYPSRRDASGLGVRERDASGLYSLIELFSDDTGNETSDSDFLEDLDQKNKIYMDKVFPLKLDPTQILEEGQNSNIDDESADIISDGIEEIRIIG